MPATQTAAPVQIGEVLNALQSDTREDLQVFLREYSIALSGKGAAGFNESIPFWKPAYRDSAIASEATLGQEPDRDIQRVLRGQARTFGALAADEGALQRLVSNLNTTTGALAREDAALEASIPALRDTLRVALPSLASLNDALPTLRAFARDALPGVRSSDETLEAGVPFIQQLSALMGPAELRGAAAALRSQIPALVDLTEESVPLLEQARALSACTNEVLVPFSELRVPNPDEPENDDQKTLLQAGARLRRPVGREPPLRRHEPVLPRGPRNARHRGASRPAARRRRHPAAAPSRRPVRDAGAAEPARARRAVDGVPADRGGHERAQADAVLGREPNPRAFVSTART